MKRESSALALMLCLGLIVAGCKQAANSTNQSQQNIAIPGQWEIALVPSGGNAGSPVVIEANLSSSAPGSGMTLFSNESNTEIFQQSTQKGPCLNFFFS